MVTLIIASSVYWSHTGLGQLKDNWKIGRMQTPSATAVAKQLFNGICLGMLGLTGFECTFKQSVVIHSTLTTRFRHPILHLAYKTWKVSSGPTKSPHSGDHSKPRTYGAGLGCVTAGSRVRQGECPQLTC
jgi:hypothetical protein